MAAFAAARALAPALAGAPPEPGGGGSGGGRRGARFGR